MNFPFGQFEPVLNSATIQALAAAIITLLVAFNIGLTTDQQNAIMGVVVAICAIIFGGSVVARSRVTPVEGD